MKLIIFDSERDMDPETKYFELDDGTPFVVYETREGELAIRFDDAISIKPVASNKIIIRLAS